MNNKIECVNECVLLGILISNDFSDKNVFHTVHTFNRRCNELFSSFCLEAYGSQLCNFDSKLVELYYVSWRKMVPRTKLLKWLLYLPLKLLDQF